MDFTTFVRKPFTVEAVEITEDNIAEVAELIGTLRYKENGTPFIAVNRRIVPNIFRVYIGFWLTKMGEDNIRCYSKRVFNQQFIETTPELVGLLGSLNTTYEDDFEDEEQVVFENPQEYPDARHTADLYSELPREPKVFAGSDEEDDEDDAS